MKRIFFLLLSGLTAAFSMGCAPLDKTPEETCEMLIDCGATYTQDECLMDIGSRELSKECVDAMFDASCEEHFTAPPSYMDTCYDTCTVLGKACDKDDLKICMGGREFVYDCKKVCRYQEAGDYSGSCGTVSPQGDVSEDGDVCWCYIQ
ncbi:hypothetical protein KKF84_13090 [Myxococcota bacterium]|nr:hypothetical protein [Myxococcota bacterium]MBU1536253.1 hypothetical protein [Myxococcota bacterium]